MYEPGSWKPQLVVRLCSVSAASARNERAALVREGLFGDLLQADIQRQHQVVSRRSLRARERAHRSPACGDFHFLEAGHTVQLGLIALLHTDLANVVGALVIVRVQARVVVIAIGIVLVARFVDAFLIVLRNPPDIADHMRRCRPERILPEQPRAHFHARKAKPLRGETRDFLVGEARADGQALEILRVLQQLFKAPPVALIDGNHGRDAIDFIIERGVDL